MQTVFFSKILKAYKKLHWYFWRSDRIPRAAAFSRDGQQTKAQECFRPNDVFCQLLVVRFLNVWQILLVWWTRLSIWRHCGDYLQITSDTTIQKDIQEILLDCDQSNVLPTRIIFLSILLRAFSFLSACTRDPASNWDPFNIILLTYKKC